jgi:serine/threonine-protein kinase HipA
VGRFVYGQVYRGRPDAVALDPVHLPLAPTTYETATLGGLFGALRDAGPDAWGRLVIERMSGHAALHELDYLLESPEDRAGALSFGLAQDPPAPRREFNRTAQLEDLRKAAALIEGPESVAEVQRQLRDLLDPTTSMGGARPKNVVEDDGDLWVAKFPAREDRWDHAAVEAGMLDLARECGIRTPDTRVVRIGDENILLVKRFDRAWTPDGYHRHRMVSALTVLNASENAVERVNWSYLLLADELRRWSSRPDQDREELFLRMAFNALISNQDDHPRNHALVAPGTEWELSPAYDLTPVPQFAQEGRQLALDCGNAKRLATRENLVSEAPRFGYSREEAGMLIDGMEQVVCARWREMVLKHGASVADCDEVSSAFCYPGLHDTGT